MFLQCAWRLFLGRSPCCLDGDEFWPRDNLLVDVRRHLRLEARRIEALVALHVREQAGIEPATAWAGNASSGLWFAGRVFAGERRFHKVQIRLLHPHTEMFYRKSHASGHHQPESESTSCRYQGLAPTPLTSFRFLAQTISPKTRSKVSPEVPRRFRARKSLSG